MSLSAKILLAAAFPVLVLGILLSVVYDRSARQQVQQQYVDKARSVVLSAESMREEMATKWKQGIFTPDTLRAWADQGHTDKVLAAVPVVTAWKAAMMKATEGGYEVRVPKFQPRNPANEPDATEARVLKMFEESGVAEHYEIDPERNAVRYFRPIRLTEECLLCHGEPANSKANWGNDQGLDPTGVRMEGWKVGEVHGAFEVVQSLDAADAQRASMLTQFLTIVAVCLIVGVAATYWLTRRNIVMPLKAETDSLTSGAQQVAAAAEEVAASSQHLSSGSSEQAGSLESTSASMEEMASMTRQNAENSRNAAELMSSMDSRVQDSNRALSSMVASMTAMKDSSQQVSKIIKTIDEIAFQTNILALNAAVEAARAGEAGLGFAVVADEVRSLAQRSAQAAKDTAGLIEDSIQKAQNGGAEVEAVSAIMRQITSSATQVRALIEQVAEASRQQTTGIDQVARAVQEMEKVTQSVAATAEETAAASEELHAQAEVTMASAGNLEALVTGSRNRSVAEPVSAPSPRHQADGSRVARFDGHSRRAA
ncbi:MAG: methyl-accepting chemotaxis protein [Vicinamibacterales bacterium]